MKTMENTEAYVQAPPQPRRNSFFDIAADQKQPNHQELTRQARNDQLGDNEKASKKYRKTKKSNKKKHRDKRKKNPHRLTSPGAQKRSLDKEKRRRKLQNAVTFVGLDNINTVNGDVEGEYRETEEAAEVKKPLAGLKLEHPLEEDPESIPLYKRIFSCWYSDLVHLEDLGMTLEQIEIVKMMSPFSEMELRRMAKRFLELDDSKTGDITMAEMLDMEEFRFNPFKERICVVLGKQPHESVTYFEFVSNLAMFSTHASTAEKLRLLFRMYDSDGDGSISHEDLSSVLLLTFGDHLDADTLGEIVDKTFSQLHTAVPGHLSFSEFAEVFMESAIQSRMTITV